MESKLHTGMWDKGYSGMRTFNCLLQVTLAVLAADGLAEKFYYL